MNAPDDAVLETIAADLDRRGWSVQPGFLDRAAAALLRERARAWWDEGGFRPATVGRGPSRHRDATVRTDHVCWLDFGTAGSFRDVHDACYEPLRLALNRRLYLGLFDLEAHVTVYPPGAFYVRHLDRFRDAAHRAVSVILYLNEDWRAADGGALRLYLPGPDGREQAHDVLPEAGTLAVFLSAEIPHEVLPARRERLSLTGWFGTRR